VCQVRFAFPYSILNYYSADWKSPITFTEGTYETKQFSLLFKYDTTGKTGAELKMKQLAEGLTVTAKAGHGKHGVDGELLNEYVRPGTKLHTSLMVNSSERFAWSAAMKPTDNFVVGAEVTGSTNMNNLKLTVSDQFTFGKTVVGAKVTQDFNSGSTHLDAIFGFTEGNTELVAAATHKFTKSGLPTATFLAKHNIDKNLWVKAAVTDAMDVKVSSAYKVNDTVTTTVGFAISNSAKTEADKYKVGLRTTFAL
jgi:hypothetical protein